jgi:hypothetical protein
MTIRATMKRDPESFLFGYGLNRIGDDISKGTDLVIRISSDLQNFLVFLNLALHRTKELVACLNSNRRRTTLTGKRLVTKLGSNPLTVFSTKLERYINT